MKRRNFIASTSLGLLASRFLDKKTAAAGELAGPHLLIKKRNPPIRTKVLVVGGGPAGIGAAIGAARTGMDTLLLENHGFFGGVASWGLGMTMNQMRPNEKPRGFVHELLLNKLQQYGPQAVRLATHQFHVNVDYFKVAIMDALDEVGCNYLVHARVVDAIMDGSRIAGVIMATKSGLREVMADTVVDCTGDADVAYFAGAPTLKETGNLSPQTLHLTISNVDRFEKKDMATIDERAKAKYPFMQKGRLRQVAHSHHWMINHAGTRDFGNFDVTDPYQFSKAECFSRRQVLQMTQSMREFGSGELKNAELTGTSPQIGIRESRRIKGGYILTEEDAAAGRRFEDAIAWRSGWLDIGFVRVTRMKIHQVPYRAIVTDQVDGLLAAGRCISATHEGASAGKSMGNCYATGHAAGIAASLASSQRKCPRELDVRKIQDILRADDVDLNKGGEEQPKNMAN